MEEIVSRKVRLCLLKLIQLVTCIATKVLEGTSNEYMTYIQLRPSFSTILVVNAWIEVHLGGLE